MFLCWSNKSLEKKNKFDLHITQEKGFVVRFSLLAILDKITFSYHSNRTWQLADAGQKKRMERTG